jgi:hypothetical protein
MDRRLCTKTSSATVVRSHQVSVHVSMRYNRLTLLEAIASSQQTEDPADLIRLQMRLRADLSGRPSLRIVNKSVCNSSLSRNANASCFISRKCTLRAKSAPSQSMPAVRTVDIVRLGGVSVEQRCSQAPCKMRMAFFKSTSTLSSSACGCCKSGAVLPCLA